jgi:2-hydroxy-3-oxopropionate reductase
MYFMAHDSERPPTIPTSVVGLGPMGAPIARNLLRAGVPLTVWNRSPVPVDEFRDGPATVAASPRDAAAPVVLAVLPDVPQRDEVLDAGLRDGLAALDSPRLVVMSTSSPEAVVDLAGRLAQDGVRVVDAPMSGGDRGARAATLSIMVGGDPADVEVVRPVLGTVGSLVTHLGPLGSGALTKLCNQVVVAGTLVATAEALVALERRGIDPRAAAAVLGGGLAGSAVLDLKQDKLLDREYSLGGSARNQLKDLRHAVAALGDDRAPVTRLALALFEEVEERGWGGSDHAVVREIL